MYYVYIISSINIPEKLYVGYTLNIKNRVQKHNEGGSVYTKDFRPWKLVFCCAFPDKTTALDFEKYLKSHSGKAFLQKRLLLKCKN